LTAAGRIRESTPQSRGSLVRASVVHPFGVTSSSVAPSVTILSPQHAVYHYVESVTNNFRVQVNRRREVVDLVLSEVDTYI